MDLKPIGRVVDPDALDALFVPTVSGPPQGDRSITFEYGACEVMVYSYGVVVVRVGVEGAPTTERKAGGDG